MLPVVSFFSRKEGDEYQNGRSKRPEDSFRLLLSHSHNSTRRPHPDRLVAGLAILSSFPEDQTTYSGAFSQTPDHRHFPRLVFTDCGRSAKRMASVASTIGSPGGVRSEGGCSSRGRCPEGHLAVKNFSKSLKALESPPDDPLRETLRACRLLSAKCLGESLQARCA